MWQRRERPQTWIILMMFFRGQTSAVTGEFWEYISAEQPPRDIMRFRCYLEFDAIWMATESLSSREKERRQQISSLYARAWPDMLCHLDYLSARPSSRLAGIWSEAGDRIDRDFEAEKSATDIGPGCEVLSKETQTCSWYFPILERKEHHRHRVGFCWFWAEERNTNMSLSSLIFGKKRALQTSGSSCGIWAKKRNTDMALPALGFEKEKATQTCLWIDVHFVDFK